SRPRASRVRRNGRAGRRRAAWSSLERRPHLRRTSRGDLACVGGCRARRREPLRARGSVRSAWTSAGGVGAATAPACYFAVVGPQAKPLTPSDRPPRASRGRYAPSPSGRLHLGNARTALISWLSCRASGGAYVLRIEDLDRGRSRPEF